MNIGGILDVSTVDFPGKICSVVFFSGCPFRCPYCHNYEIVLNKGIDVDVKYVISKISNNFLIDGVCLTGGEPLMQDLNELKELILKIKDVGLSVKLDTNGYFPNKLSKLISLVDYVAMDFKTVPENYYSVTGRSDSANKVLESLKVLSDSSTEYEIRTTVVPTIIDKSGIIKIAEILSEYNVKRYVLQQFRNEKTLDKKFRNINPYPKEYLFEIAREVKKFIPEVEVRSE